MKFKNRDRVINRRIIIGVAAAGLLTACSGSEQAAPETVTQTQTSFVQAAPAPSMTPVAPPEAAASEGSSWTMPNLIGQNLQAAQDAVQSLTGNPMFFSTSTDLTGNGRNQILDANWQVCSSTPAPGETFTASTPVNFGVVRIDVESCP